MSQADETWSKYKDKTLDAEDLEVLRGALEECVGNVAKEINVSDPVILKSFNMAFEVGFVVAMSWSKEKTGSK